MRKKLTSLSLLAFLGFGGLAFAQVTGVVTDGSGLPEIDAEVVVKGTGTTVYTDESGNFNIDAKIGDVLVINGKEFRVTSNNLGVLAYTSDNVALDEVVITSIFDTPQKSGESTVSADQIKDFNPSLSVDQMLGGKVSGLVSTAQSGAPGGTANVNIRGALGLNGGVKSPLYVVDGTYLTESDMNTINPLDIESIRVLKDASQLAIYGARGANGVVIVKTKTARKGGTVITYAGRVGVVSMMDLPNMDLMNTSELIRFQQDVNQINGALGRNLSAQQWDNLSKINTDWADETFRKGIITSNYVSIASNEGNISQSFSLGHDRDQGAVIYYKGFERITTSYNFNVKAKEWLRYGASVNGSYQTRDLPRDRYNGQSPFYGVINNQPYANVYLYDAEGNIRYNASGYPEYNPNNGGGYPGLDEMAKVYNKTRQFRLYGSTFAEVEIAKGLTARTTFGATYLRQQQESFNRNDTYLAVLLSSPSSKTDNSRDNLDYNWKNEINYLKSIDKHNFRFTAASEFQKTNNYQIVLAGRNFPSNDLITQNLAQEILGGGSSYTNRVKISRFGYIGAFSYDYDKKYFVDAYIRRDGTSLTGWENQFGTFWGVSAGWDIAREGFLKGSKTVNSLVVRASYGEVGDDSSIATYSNLNLLTLGFYNGQFAGLPNRTLAAPKTTWEANQKLNIGADFALFKNSLSGSFAYFHDLRSNFIFKQTYSPTAGTFNSYLNSGELQSSGIEIDLNYDVVRKKNFELSVYGNITNIKYKVNDLNGANILPVTGSYIPMRHVKGESPYQYFLVRWAGVNSETGQAQYYDINGNITTTYNGSDAVATGKSPLPKVLGGFGLNTKIYGFDINADFTYSAGAYTYNMVYLNATDPTGLENKDVSAFNYWKQPGDNAQFAKPTTEGHRTSTQFLDKNDYILFRSLSLGYNVNKKMLESTPLKSLRIYGQVQNLAMFTNFNGNPIQGTGSSESIAVTQEGYVSNSFTQYGYPMTRTYSLGINVTF